MVSPDRKGTRMHEKETFTGGVFSEEVDDGRAPATIDLQPGVVVATLEDGRTFRITYLDARLEMAGSDGRMLFCRNPDASITIFCKDRRFPKYLEQESAGCLAEQFDAMRSGANRAWRQGYYFMFGVTASILLMFASVFVFVPIVARAMIPALPIEVDQQIGDSAIQSMTLEGPKVTDPIVTGAIQTIVDRIEPHANDQGFTFNIQVVDAPIENAFALPGGQIVVYTGLIESSKTPEQLAGVLAHEMAHVTHRHGLKRMGEHLGFFVAFEIVIGGSDGLVGLGAEIARSAALSAYSRGEEAEADAEAVRVLHAAGVDPDGVAQFFELMKHKHGDHGMEWMSSHPSHGNRVQAIRDQIKTLPQREYQPLDLDWKQVRAA
ncbi:MAG: M48 family metallopeptidase, partial [Planctomycetales bacterium]